MYNTLMAFTAIIRVIMVKLQNCLVNYFKIAKVDYNTVIYLQVAIM